MISNPDFVVRGGTVVAPAGAPPGDLLAGRGRSKAVGRIPDQPGLATVDASGLLVLPGAIDPVTGLSKSSGCQTFFYTNAQSARLQFYHDHAMGITRINVYAGEAAGYVLTDAVESDLIYGTNFSGVNINCVDGV